MSSVSNLTTTDGPQWDSAHNHGPVVSVISWLLIVAAFLVIGTRLGTRYATVRVVRSDDITIIAALIFAIGQTVAVSLAVVNGLGREGSNSSSSQLITFQKNAYAADFLYITSLCLTKVSLCLYLDTLTPKRNQKLTSVIIGAFTCLWAFSAIFVHAFQCKLPDPWNFLDEKCIDIAAFWTYFDVLNIVTDIGLIVLPFMILLGLQVERRKKAVILACFASRLFTIAATTLQIYYLNHAWSHSPTADNLPYTLYLPTLLTQIVQALSLITACIPYLKPFLEALETGMIRAGGAGSTVRSYGFGSKGYSSKHSKDTTSHTVSTNDSRKSGGKSKLKNVLGGKVSSLVGGGGGGQRSFGNGGAVAMENLGGDGGEGVRNEIRPGSDGGSTGSRAGIIKKTVDWEVRDEDGGGGGMVGEAV